MQNHSPILTKQKKPKSREVSSRFLSPISNDHQYGNKIPSPNNNLVSPLNYQKPRSSTDSKNHKKHENTGGFLHGLWPSSSNSTKKQDTLANHLGYDRIKDISEKSDDDQINNHNHNPVFLNRQRSCTERKENHYKPVYGGGSMRYTGKFKFPTKSNDNNDRIIPGRFSIDETALRKKYPVYNSSDTNNDSESEQSSTGICSGSSFDTPVTGKGSPAASYMAPTVSSRKHGIEVASKFMYDLSSSSRSRRWSADSAVINNYQKVAFSPDGDLSKKLSLKNVVKPPTSPSSKGGKGVGNIISIGIEFLKGKKYSSSSSSTKSSTLMGSSAENVHELRILHNRLLQWRYCNARADAVNANIIKRVKNNFVCAWNGLIKLQQSVLQKKLQLQKEKLEMKLNYMLQSQIKVLEIWGSMERQHISAISVTKDYLHSVVCKVPLVDGAKVESQSASIIVRHASDVADSINLILSTFSPMIEKSVGVLVELAMVVRQEKMLLEECLELFRIISALEVQERSLQSNIMQLNVLQLQKHHY